MLLFAKKNLIIESTSVEALLVELDVEGFLLLRTIATTTTTSRRRRQEAPEVVVHFGLRHSVLLVRREVGVGVRRDGGT